MKVLSLEQLLGATLSTNQMLALQQSQLVPLRFPPSGQFSCFASLGFVPIGSCDTFLRSDRLSWLLRFLRILVCGTQSRCALRSLGLMLIESVLSKYLAIQEERRICQCNMTQTPVVRRLDNTIHRININPVDNAENFVNTFHWMVIYLLDSVMRPLNNCFQMNTRDHGARTCDVKNALYLARISSLLALH